MPLLPVRCSPSVPLPSSVFLSLLSPPCVNCQWIIPLLSPLSLLFFIPYIICTLSCSVSLSIPLPLVLASVSGSFFLGPEPVSRVSVSRGRLKSRDGEADCSCAVVQWRGGLVRAPWNNIKALITQDSWHPAPHTYTHYASRSYTHTHTHTHTQRSEDCQYRVEGEELCPDKTYRSGSARKQSLCFVYGQQCLRAESAFSQTCIRAYSVPMHAHTHAYCTKRCMHEHTRKLKRKLSA